MSKNETISDSIQKTKKGFEESFESGVFYNKQTQDKEHLNLIIDCLPIKEGMKILDLGTGTGYLSFPLARMFLDAKIIGLDIVEKALEANRQQALEENLFNLYFVSYDGITFPFANEEFDMIITRYALHHFPIINDTFHEIRRILKPQGTLFISDPAPNDDDDERFVDAYMQMKMDGHIKFYTKVEWIELGKKYDLEYEKGFETTIRFPKKRDTAPEFDNMINKYDDKIIKGYDLEITEDEIYITEKVNNLIFYKNI